MKRLLATAFAAAILPAAAASNAAALTVATPFVYTYNLACGVNKADGVALKVRMMVKNTSGRTIKQGTNIQIRVLIAPYSLRTYTVVAYRDVYANDSIGFDQPSKARACSAKYSVPRHLR